MYLNPEEFAFTRTLEQNWREIRAEFEALAPAVQVPWPERHLYGMTWDVAGLFPGHGWGVVGLYAFGRKLDDNCARCPLTTQLVEAIPGMSTAGFSCLTPGTHIKPHRGYSDAVLRCHLGLIVPEGCSMRVAGETRSWSEGRCLVFDDTSEHEVWHRGDRPRIVLLLDFPRPGATQGVAMPEVVAASLDGR
jgi:aspartyl/asparaginyl beta-hydroxylase (cupin superfamily)